jgi:hypothetical protein
MSDKNKALLIPPNSKQAQASLACLAGFLDMLVRIDLAQKNKIENNTK